MERLAFAATERPGPAFRIRVPGVFCAAAGVPPTFQFVLFPPFFFLLLRRPGLSLGRRDFCRETIRHQRYRMRAIVVFYSKYTLTYPPPTPNSSLSHRPGSASAHHTTAPKGRDRRQPALGPTRLIPGMELGAW